MRSLHGNTCKAFSSRHCLSSPLGPEGMSPQLLWDLSTCTLIITPHSEISPSVKPEKQEQDESQDL